SSGSCRGPAGLVRRQFCFKGGNLPFGVAQLLGQVVAVAARISVAAACVCHYVGPIELNGEAPPASDGRPETGFDRRGGLGQCHAAPSVVDGTGGALTGAAG